MAHRNPDRWKELATTSGTSDFTMSGTAEAGGFIVMSAGLPSNGDTSWYCAVNSTAGEWEVALGTRSSSTVLARPATPLASSNAGAKVNFSAAPLVFSTVPGAAIIGPTAPAFRAHLSADQTGISSVTFTKVNLNTEEFDTNGCFDNATNYRFTPTVAGYYQFNWLLRGDGASLTGISSVLRKNGSTVAEGTYLPISSTAQRSGGSRLIYMNGSTDYVELFGYLIGSTLKFGSGSTETNLSGHFVRPG